MVLVVRDGVGIRALMSALQIPPPCLMEPDQEVLGDCKEVDVPKKWVYIDRQVSTESVKCMHKLLNMPMRGEQ